MPKVSVIVPNYNYARYLPERIDSILNQSFQDFELIILDDCSTDGSREVIERYRNHPRVSEIKYNEKNSGSPFAQWEKGMSIASGEYIWIAEADDVAHPEFLKRCVDMVEKNPDVTVVKTMSHLIDGDGNDSPRPPFEKFLPDGSEHIYDGNTYIKSELIKWNHCYNASMILFRRDAWGNLTSRPYLHLRYVGDWLFWGLMLRDRKLGEIRQELNSFRLHGKSVTDGAMKTLRQRIEGEIVANLFLEMLPDAPRGQRLYNRYQLMKFYRKLKRAPLADGEISPDTYFPEIWKGIGGRDYEYPLLWLFKHAVWGFLKK